jgi:hypothetical protein
MHENAFGGQQLGNVDGCRLAHPGNVPISVYPFRFCLALSKRQLSANLNRERTSTSGLLGEALSNSLKLVHSAPRISDKLARRCSIDGQLSRELINV